MSDDGGDWYDRKGEPITRERWLSLWMDKSYQVVRQTKVGDVLVSTIWLGFDHGFGWSDWPVIFETMVFGTLGQEYEEQYRYTTETDALEHHREIVEQLRAVARALT